MGKQMVIVLDWGNRNEVTPKSLGALLETSARKLEDSVRKLNVGYYVTNLQTNKPRGLR